MYPTYIDETEPENYNNYGIAPTLPFNVENVTIGPVALNYTAGGLTSKYWGAYYNPSGNAIYLRDMALGTDTFIISEPDGVSRIALAFDQNGNDVYAWITLSGVLKLRWFDSSVGSDVVDTFGQAQSLTLTMDMKYFPSSAESDILFYYIRDNAIYARVQRDKYEIEYSTPVTSGANELIDSGMRVDYRFQVRWR